MLSHTEENYLKSLLHLTMESGVGDTMESGRDSDGGRRGGGGREAGTNELAANLGVKPASVNNMLKKFPHG